MKKLILIFGFMVATIAVNAQTNPNTVRVNGYVKNNGTIVQPYVKTAPNNTKKDNYSYPGNYNPNTGRVSRSRGYGR
jgi:hypothetical protein